MASRQMRVLGKVADFDRLRSVQNKTFDEIIAGKVAAGSDHLERAFFAKQWNGADGHIVRDEDGNDTGQRLRKGAYYSTYRDSDQKFGEHSEGDVKTAHSMYDGNESQIQSLIKYETGKVANDAGFYGTDSNNNVIYDPSEINQRIDTERNPMGSFMGNLPSVMQDAGLSQSSAGAASIGSFFGTQAQRKELKQTRLTLDENKKWAWKQDKHAFVQDFAENMGQYAATTGKTSPIKRLSSVWGELSAKEASGVVLTPTESRSKKDLQSIAVTLDQRLRGGGVGHETEGGEPVSASAGGPGRVNEAMQEFVNAVRPAPAKSPQQSQKPPGEPQGYM